MTAVPPEREGAYGQRYEDPYGVRDRHRHRRDPYGDAAYGEGAADGTGADPYGTGGSSYGTGDSGSGSGEGEQRTPMAGRFRESVDALTDPLNDPLPGQRHPEQRHPEQGDPAEGRPQGPAQDVSPWFRDQHAPRASTSAPAPERPPQQYGYGQQHGYEQRAYEQSSYGSWGGGGHGGEAPYNGVYAPETPAYKGSGGSGAEGGSTAALPVFTDDPKPADASDVLDVLDPLDGPDTDGAFDRPRADHEDDGPDGPDGTDGTDGEALGGRAERRRAARARGNRGGRGSHGSHGRGRGGTGHGNATPQAEQPAGPPASRLEALRAKRARKDRPAIVASRALGEVLISLGVLMLLFVVYQLWWTNIIAGSQAGGATQNLEDQWKHGGGGGGHQPDPERDPGSFAPGKGFAILWLPKLDVKAPIAQGISKPQVLDKGMVGHYDSKPFRTAMPWDKKGNFALAGHRNTHGEPFRYINRLVAGDDIVVETASKYYTYKMANRLPSTGPDNTDVIRPVPKGSGFNRPGRYITLTTCTPEFTSKYRLIVWGKMVDERPRSKGKPDALLR